mmetsp:Transcript_17160/g.26007  ORF Transcript_17160/g.26007 Transcript_17160/m.26007 type:complete len:534 (+) Transcript_17160:138-1739(+)|eukprot:CAMPEP_0194234362 /NCGR_PEP_ID=MMETSP0158-20130606/2095_1 /TAXON_ID=33649 /ORGANISM="Thalassionema nitzschioides, Strain L26-B" /LENGTH=533 /DNA_ID=CAMNT_0038967511 /DNA_START=113 /DNA_END=1714 /DNA_ORIENTATION=-
MLGFRITCLSVLFHFFVFIYSFSFPNTITIVKADEANSEECLVNDKDLLLPYEREFYINGTWMHPNHAQVKTVPVIDPSTAEPIASVSLGGDYDVELAVSAARGALKSWSHLPKGKRRKYVERLLKIYQKRRKEMAKLISMEMGAPIDVALDSQVGSGSYYIKDFLDSFDYFEGERTVPGVNPEEASTTIFYEPVGVVAMITPWNWPMNQVTLKVIPALLVGCTCILKPSEVAPLSSLLFAQMIHEAGFPAGVFNLVNGDGLGVGTQLSKHPNVDMVSFTGSTRAGALVSKNAADSFKRVSLELGGKGANIIFADVKNLADTITSGVWSCFANSGQSCNAPTRMLVQKEMYAEAVDIAKAVAEEEIVKSAHERGDHLGPVVSQVQYDRIQNYIGIGMREGAKLVTGGLGRPEGTNGKGYYVKPTVFADVTNKMTISREEIFGPVLCIMSFETEDEAVEIANDTPYGLTNYVHTANSNRLRRMARALRSGMVEMNGMSQDDGAPFGGMKASGNGREGGVYGLEEFCEIKAVTGL